MAKVFEKPDKNWTFHFVINEFKRETDRAAVILVAAIIDETLNAILKSKLIPLPSASDDLFDGPNAPISTFSSKIDLAYRLGLISNKLCRDIHLIRKIRNSFAHDIYGCNFQNGGIKARVMELCKSCTIMPLYEEMLFQNHEKVEKDTRGIFLFISSMIIYHLNILVDAVTCIDPIKEISIEIVYGDGDYLAERQKEHRSKASDNK